MTRIVIALVAIVAATAGAQERQPPVRPLGAVVARSTIQFTTFPGAAQFVPTVLNVRALPGGRLLVNDPAGRKLVLLDSTLGSAIVVADTTASTGTAYSGRIAGLIAYRGDSSLFVDPQSMSMMVIDPNGKIGRVMSVPRAEDAGVLAGPMGGAAFDGKGRLVYRAPLRFRMIGAPNGGAPSIPSPPDSALVVSVDLATRQVDTLGVIRTPKINLQVMKDDKGNVRVTAELNPLPVVDDFAVLSDGSVAFVRGRDYHIDFVNTDGTRTSAPKIPFEWQRLTDEDKVAFIDSLKAAREKLAAQSANTVSQASAPPAAAPDGMKRTVIQVGPGGPVPAGVQRGAPEVAFVAPSELPDYKPPFFTGAVRADLDDNLWVRTIPTRQIPGGPVYDVVNRKGVLVDRVQVPANTSILGFGPGGDVFLVQQDGTVQTIERARIR